MRSTRRRSSRPLPGCGRRPGSAAWRQQCGSVTRMARSGPRLMVSTRSLRPRRSQTTVGTTATAAATATTQRCSGPVLVEPALSVPIVVFSDMVRTGSVTPPEFPGAGWSAPVLGTVLFALRRPAVPDGRRDEVAQPPTRDDAADRAWPSASRSPPRGSRPGIGGFDLDFWWELAAAGRIMLLGHWQEMRALGAGPGRARRPGRAAARRSRTRHRRRRARRSPVAELAVDDVVLVRSGGRVPADGDDRRRRRRARRVDDHRRIQGRSPGRRGPGRRRHGGHRLARCASGSTAVGDDTALAGIQRLVAEAQASSLQGRRRSPTGPPPCCSTSPWPPASSRSSPGPARQTSTRPSPVPSPCW